MTFEEALRLELMEIPALEKRVFPVVAPQESKDKESKPKKAFLVYRKASMDFNKTLSGASRDKIDATYELALLTLDYVELQELTFSIVDKLHSFLGRNIGNEGPLVRNVTVKLTGDSYDFQVELLRANISLQVKY